MEAQTERERPRTSVRAAGGRAELELLTAPASGRQEQESFIDETETETESESESESESGSGTESEAESETEDRGSHGGHNGRCEESEEEAEDEEHERYTTEGEEREEERDRERRDDCEEDDCVKCEGAAAGHFSDPDEMAPERTVDLAARLSDRGAEAADDDEEAVLLELARSSAPAPATPGPDSLRSESGICSSLESSYQEETVGAVGGAASADDQLARLRRDLAREARQEIRHAIAAKNEELRELRSQLQLGQQRAASAELLGQRRQTELPQQQQQRQQQQQQLGRLRERIRRLQTEREELKAEVGFCPPPPARHITPHIHLESMTFAGR